MALKVAYATRPLAGESVCGDQCGYWTAGVRIVLAVADGLGHGEEAARAALVAIDCIGEYLDCSCEEMFALCDTRLIGTRGAALAVAIIEPDSGRMTVASVGNIRVLLLRDSCELRLDGGRGIVGGGYKMLVPETLVLQPGNALAIFTDGLAEFPPLRKFLSGATSSVQDQAQAILEQYAHNTDDAAVLIYLHDE